MTGRRLVVLQGFPPPDRSTNSYTDQLARAVAPAAEVVHFTWLAALLGRYDLVHVHWPELMIRSRSRVRTVVARLLFGALLARWTVLRTPVVRTIHNAVPHEAGGSAERALLARLDRLVRSYVVMSRETPVPSGKPFTYVPHGDYRHAVDPQLRVEPVEGRLVCFGQIRRYKKIDELIEAVRASDRDLSLVVAGPAFDRPLLDELTVLAAPVGNVALRAGFLSDRDLQVTVQSAELVVLPYRESLNSGAALHALSLGRPVLMPESPAGRDLVADVGPMWVRLYDGILTPETIHAALTWVADRSGTGAPDLTRRDWSTVGAATSAIYRSVTAHDS